jgi:2-phosphosulfolactate phosphatase
MGKRIDVWTSPNELYEGALKGKTVIVADILRATTTVISAFEAGAASVIPVSDIEKARQYAKEIPDSLLCGERNGYKIEGFDLGNSPLEYKPEIVSGKNVILASTNGSRAFEIAQKESKKVISGSFNNLSTLGFSLNNDEDIAILCSGRLGMLSAEDLYYAGALTKRLLSTRSAEYMNDGARVAMNLWGKGEGVLGFLRSTHHGHYLCSIGFDDDLAQASKIGSSELIPYMKQERLVL